MIKLIGGVAIALVCFGVRAAEVDLRPIDEWLATWDRFAQGENSLMPRINESWPKARESLIRGLREKDRRAPSRAVFMMLVQVGMPLPADSTTGQAWRAYVGEAFPVTVIKAEKVYSPWHFYQWWLQNKSPAHDFPLLQQWLSRDFAKRTVIPMYMAQLREGAK